MSARLSPATVAGAAGVASLALAVAIVVVPPSTPVVGPAVATAYWWLAAPAIAVTLGLVARSFLRSLGDDRDRATDRGPSVAVPGHGVTDEPDHDAATPGERVDDLIDRVDGREGGAVGRTSDRNRVRVRVREVAVTVLCELGYDVESATTMLEQGTWTDRPRAAAFLGDGDVTPPVRIRVADWASGRAFERTVEETVDAIAALSGVAVDDRDPAGFEAVDRLLGVDGAPRRPWSVLPDGEFPQERDASEPTTRPPRSGEAPPPPITVREGDYPTDAGPDDDEGDEPVSEPLAEVDRP